MANFSDAKIAVSHSKSSSCNEKIIRIVLLIISQAVKTQK